MDSRLVGVKVRIQVDFGLDEECFYAYTDEEGLDGFDIAGIAIIIVDEDSPDKLALSFYSNCGPVASANIATAMQGLGLDFIIYENVYPMVEGDSCSGLLFGDDADQRFYFDVYKEYAERARGYN